MAVTCLPTWPFVLFGIIEPAMLILAYVTALRDPFQYYADQAPNFPPASRSDMSPQALALTLQLVNVLLLLAAAAVICCWTTNTRVARWFLVALAFADYGHIYGTFRGVGPEYFWNPAEWNGMVAGNVGVSLFLNIMRWLTVAGAFGRLRGEREKTKAV